MVAVGRLHINDKVMHFCAYVVLASLPVIGFRDRRTGIVAGLFVLGILLEAGQHFSPGRAMELVMSSPTVPASVAAPCWACRSAPLSPSSEPRAIPPARSHSSENLKPTM
jgi:hypothetical protein